MYDFLAAECFGIAVAISSMLPQEQEQISEQDQEKPRPASANQPVDLSNDRERAQAAAAIQKAFRGHKTRRELKGCGLDASTRWDEAVKDATYNSLTRPNDTPRFTRTSQARNDSGDAPQQDIPHTKSSDARKEWRRVGQIARRANADDVSESSSDASGSSTDDVQQGMSREEVQKRRHKRTEARNSRQVNAKTMGIQYFLEMVDQKHRYGSNLRKYHNHWKGQDTKQNFFYWLDYGEGKEVELEECSRERLQTEQVRYLSREERQHYLVTIGKDGLLYWAKNGERVWTKDELYRDSLKGIVPIRDETPKFKYNIKPEDESSSSSSEDSDSEDDINTAPPEDDPSHGYDNEAFHHAKGLNKFKEVSPAVIFNHMIKSHMKKGHKWIFVSSNVYGVRDCRLMIVRLRTPPFGCTLASSNLVHFSILPFCTAVALLQPASSRSSADSSEVWHP